MSVVPPPDAKVQSLIRDLPDDKGPLVFLERLQQEQPQVFKTLSREPGLLADTLALAAWSPLLSATLEQNPHYISWLQRERQHTLVRTRDELKESLARFALTNSSLSTPVILSRFRRRELLRSYLHDIRNIHSLAETTEELSNVADAVLDYALNVARQDLENKFGLPRRTDERGRVATADFTIVALGKLGSFELNYASDIDLMFIYSDEGSTSGVGERGEVTNREYFVKLAETVAKLVGQPAGEGAAYRVDLRLRPHGRDGALACSLDEAVRYYSSKAQRWELQTLIRSRSAAGSAALFAKFFESVRSSVFQYDVSVNEALASVRLAKQKIDRHREADTNGFNVKLHRGGIREIEFIAQALQLAHGGHDDWLRASHTLISLGRLADRNLIYEHERTELSDAYFFLRKLEHRLQMEHGLQTHTVPSADRTRTLIARRMDYSGENALAVFDRALAFHTGNVRRCFDRVFRESGIDESPTAVETAAPAMNRAFEREHDAIAGIVRAFTPHLAQSPASESQEPLADVLRRAVAESANPHRAITLTSRVAASVEKVPNPLAISREALVGLIRLSGASESFGELLASNPNLVNSLAADVQTPIRRDFRTTLRAAVDPESTLSAEFSALRRSWLRLLLEIGQRDAAGEISIAESNRLQTELAVASLNVAYLIARRELARRFGRLSSGPRIAILALGRLSTGGVDYGSDLDVVAVYDSLVPSPINSLTREEAYARLAELMIAALSNLTREGYLYRVDMRLRPNGQSGPLLTSSDSFLDYARERADVWEWLAYVKLRAVAGDLELGKMVETHARHAIHERARLASRQQLQEETRRVRDRLEAEKGGRVRQDQIDIKYGPGGMLDVYFAARYLQLASDVSDEGEDRSTQSTLERLQAEEALSAANYDSLSSGYSLLRSVDHQLRLIVGKSTRLPAADHAVTADIATQLGFNSATHLREMLLEHMGAIRSAYLRITSEL